jgi:hypothetical protein
MSPTAFTHFWTFIYLTEITLICLFFIHSVCHYSTRSQTYLDKHANGGNITAQQVWRTHLGFQKHTSFNYINDKSAYRQLENLINMTGVIPLNASKSDRRLGRKAIETEFSENTALVFIQMLVPRHWKIYCNKTSGSHCSQIRFL